MKAIELTNANFAKETDTGLSILIDFYAEWCGPCRMLKPVIEQLIGEYKGVYKVCSVNVDDYPDLAAKFKVENIPTLVIMKKGQTVELMVGFHPIEEIREFMDKHIG